MDEQPAMVIYQGAVQTSDMVYDETAGTLVLTFESTGNLMDTEGYYSTVIALTGAVADPETEDGPPEEFIGAYLECNAYWELVPPEPENINWP